MLEPPSRTVGSIVVVGAINVDLVVVAPRLPGPGETVVGGDLETYGGGKGANAAVAAARVGATVTLIGAVGNDTTGAEALADLRGEGIDTSHIAVLDGVATGVALIVVDADGENQIAVGAGANGAVTADHVRRALAAVLPAAQAVLVSTEIPDDAVAAAVDVAVNAGVPCILNPAPVTNAVPALVARGVVLTPNEGELVDLLRRRGQGVAETTDAAAVAYIEEFARPLVAVSGASLVVTMGGDGALVVMPDGSAIHVAAPPTTVVDTTGAGDTMNGVLAAHLAGGHELSDAVRIAVAAASVSVSRVGARGGMPAADELEAALARSSQ
jgi:ribokinase